MKRVRILIVDDSAFARKVVREIVQSERTEVVGAARDGHEALALAASLNPDLIICDLAMPGLDGIEFIRRQMAARPVPILILSSAAQDAAEVFTALNSGAVDVVHKPSGLANDLLRDVKVDLMEKIMLIMRIAPEKQAPVSTIAASPERIAFERRIDLVAIGISTGGPQALRRLIPLFPRSFPAPIAIVLHMPVGYTAMYAEQLNEICALEVKEAAEGDVLEPGMVLLAQAGRHLTVQRTGTGSVISRLSVQPINKLHRPSVDVLFRSVAETFGARALGVVMTGMGDDGKEGAGCIKASGGTVITEAEQSCVIYGMPRSVVEARLSDSAVPLDQMAETIINFA
ncbi:MAG: chemotaxis-specific protein-glutamate methyltransferase CheB [Verrucomicrobiales bacterium]|nr:chemotaxis-specific protein-glutamate methyltransferase CheB [Verrucomicrobiales bacterium]